MKIKKIFTAGIFAALLCAASAFSQGTAKVTVSNNKFEPKTITVKAGSEVVWENKEGTHTVTADDGSWDSAGLSAGKTFSHKFDNPGSYKYHCAFHGSSGGHNMAGVVNVTQ